MAQQCAALLGMRIGEASHPGPTPPQKRRLLGGRCTQWRVSTQQHRKSPAACQNCHESFTAGQPRLCTIGSAQGKQPDRKYIHLSCLAGGWQAHYTLEALDPSDGHALVTVQNQIQQLHSLPPSQAWPIEAHTHLAPTSEAPEDLNAALPETPYEAQRNDDAMIDDTLTPQQRPQPPRPTQRDPDTAAQPVNTGGDAPSSTPHLPQPNPHQPPLQPLLPVGIGDLDLDWYSQLTWDYIADLPGCTFVQVPKRHQTKLAAIQNQLITGILQLGIDRDESLPHWKALIMLPWTLLAKPHNTRDGSHTAAQLIDDRLTLWQLGLHESLHQQTHTDTAPQPLRPPSKQEHKQRMGARATRVATLVANRETSRALDTLIDQQHIIIDNRVAGAVQALYPLTANHPTYPHGQGINADAIDRVAAQIPRALRRMGRLTTPGILGLRPEHLLPLLDDPVHTEHFQQFMGCLALGFIHEQALAFLRRGQISPKPKGDTYRPLLLSNVLRRLAIKALMMAEKEAVQNLTHIRQYGVGAPDGASKLTKLLRTLTDQHPDLCVLSLDICAAFQNISRASIAANLHDHPIVDQAFRSWYPHSTTTTHRITLADGSHRTIQANQGLDQGCPLASYGYTKGNEEDQTELEG